MNPLILIDGNNLLWRAALAMSGLSAGGQPTGGVHGFFTVLLRFAALTPGEFIVCWDPLDEGPLERLKMFPGYKGKDKPPDEERQAALRAVGSQRAILVQMLGKLGVLQAWARGWEADDVIATLAGPHSRPRAVRVLTGDRDLLQIVNPRVTVVQPTQEGPFRDVTPEAVYEEYGVTPMQFADWKALVGDNSDHIPGVKGIGPVAATTLLQNWLTLDELVASIERGDAWEKPLQPRWAKLVKESADGFKLSRKLVPVNRAAPVLFMSPAFDWQGFVAALGAWQLNQLLGKLDAFKALIERTRP